MLNETHLACRFRVYWASTQLFRVPRRGTSPTERSADRQEKHPGPFPMGCQYRLIKMPIGCHTICLWKCTTLPCSLRQEVSSEGSLYLSGVPETFPGPAGHTNCHNNFKILLAFATHILSSQTATEFWCSYKGEEPRLDEETIKTLLTFPAIDLCEVRLPSHPSTKITDH